jgi:hypothetical protein
LLTIPIAIGRALEAFSLSHWRLFSLISISLETTTLKEDIFAIMECKNSKKKKTNMKVEKFAFRFVNLVFLEYGLNQ